MDENPLTVWVDGGTPAVVRVDGELDLAGAPRLLWALAGLDGDVELECSGLKFIDSAGLLAFVRAHRACAARGARLVVVEPSPEVERLVHLAGLDTVLHLRRRNAEAS